MMVVVAFSDASQEERMDRCIPLESDLFCSWQEGGLRSVKRWPRWKLLAQKGRFARQPDRRLSGHRICPRLTVAILSQKTGYKPERKLNRWTRRSESKSMLSIRLTWHLGTCSVHRLCDCRRSAWFSPAAVHQEMYLKEKARLTIHETRFISMAFLAHC